MGEKWVLSAGPGAVLSIHSLPPGTWSHPEPRVTGSLVWLCGQAAPSKYNAARGDLRITKWRIVFIVEDVGRMQENTTCNFTQK